MSKLTLYLPERAANPRILASGKSLDTLRAMRQWDRVDSKGNKADWEYAHISPLELGAAVTWAEIWTTYITGWTSAQRKNPALYLVY